MAGKLTAAQAKDVIVDALREYIVRVVKRACVRGKCDAVVALGMVHEGIWNDLEEMMDEATTLATSQLITALKQAEEKVSPLPKGNSLSCVDTTYDEPGRGRSRHRMGKVTASPEEVEQACAADILHGILCEGDSVARGIAPEKTTKGINQ